MDEDLKTLDIIDDYFCPECESEVEEINCVNSCVKCDWWEYSSS